MIEACAATLYLLAIAAVGLVWLLAVSGRSRALPPGFVISAAFPAGAFLFAYSAFLLMLVGRPLRAATVVLLLAALLVAGAGAAWRRGAFAVRWSARAQWRVRESAAGLLLLVLLVVQARSLIVTPYGGDGLAFWRPKALAIRHEGTVRSPLFMHPATQHTHKQYPVLVPILQAGLMFLYDDTSPAGERSVHVAFLLSLFALLYAGMRRHASRFVSLLLLLALAMASGGRLGGGYVTAAVAVYLLGTILFLLARDTAHPRAALAGAVLLAGGLVFTKAEGGAYGAVLAALLGVDALRRRSGPAFGGAAGFVVAGAILVLPWLLFRTRLPGPFEDRYLENLTLARGLDGLVRVPYLLSLLAGDFLSLERWGPVWLLGFWAGARHRPPLLVGGFAGAALTIWLAVNLVDPQGLGYYLNTSSRFLFTLVPLALLVVAERLRSPEGLGRPASVAWHVGES